MLHQQYHWAIINKRKINYKKLRIKDEKETSIKQTGHKMIVINKK
jgi:hypothetical protein